MESDMSHRFYGSPERPQEAASTEINKYKYVGDNVYKWDSVPIKQREKRTRKQTLQQTHDKNMSLYSMCSSSALLTNLQKTNLYIKKPWSH